MDIKSVMVERGISQAELAKMMLDTTSEKWQKMSDDEKSRRSKSIVSYVSQLISGKSDPSMKKLDRLAELIGCQRWEFFKDEIKATGMMLVPIPEEPKPSEEEKVSEPSNDNQDQQCGGVAPTEGAEQGTAAEPAAKAAPEAPNQQAEAVKAVRFSYQCPACGRQIKVCISEE